ncbi:MAG: PQQ-dependent sugar dehydrogenase [Acidimicrobiaceae bacterium]|nr:PQQ-dependent sugar dehydrogenase [Acidimicrobiaceae bacterium]MCY4281145.1 PQQ-dependent sugar dehydrogenase [Acidimicrobiaceae bacterium]
MTTPALLGAACAADDELAVPVPTAPVVTATSAVDGPGGTAPSSDDGTGSAAAAPLASQQDPAARAQAGRETPGSEQQTAPETATTSATSTATSATTAVGPDGDFFDAEVALQPLLSLSEPIDMAAPPGDDLLWIAERVGRVSRVDPGSGEVVETILDISAETRTTGEHGLLGIAVTEGWLYVNFTDLAGDSRVDAFERDGDRLGDRRRNILMQAQPFGNHNGGDLAVGPDGFLYVAFGDGGSGGDPLDSGQDPSTWLGALLRIDPRPDSPPGEDAYVAAAGNPFTADADGGRRPEIFLNGVRNPWRFSFDRHTGDLWIADVGQDQYEEVTLLLAANGGGAGANLGWRLREGLHSFAGDKPPGNVDPVWQYGHSDGCSVTGGYVYRGSAIEDLYGAYVFGDFCTSRLWALQISGGEIEFRDLGADVPGGRLISFGEDASGELYTMSLNGEVSRLVDRRTFQG